MINDDAVQSNQLRLLLEEICCDICRFRHANQNASAIPKLQIIREFYLGSPGLFADILVVTESTPPYYVEVKYGYPTATLLAHLRRKYNNPKAKLGDVRGLIVVAEAESEAARLALEQELAQSLLPGFKIEVWDEKRVLSLLLEQFGVEVASLKFANMREIREMIERAKGFHAFGGVSLSDYRNDPLTSELLWHFDFWRLLDFRKSQGKTPTSILPPGLYRNVAVIVGDLCSFSSYVRDTRDDDLIRHCLTSFYSKARYEIINQGGMLYQFVGDSVVGIFGIPDQKPAFTEAALQAGRNLISIAGSVSNHWQRHLDRAQPASGLRAGIALGDLQIVSLRPFGRTHMGVIGDAINLAARLQAAAQPNEIVMSNTFYNRLDESAQNGLIEMEPMEARNVGNIKAWRTGVQLNG